MTYIRKRLVLNNAEVWLYSGIFTPRELRKLYLIFYGSLHWKESAIKLFGREVRSPRLSIWYGERPYKYSGLTWPVKAMPAELYKIKRCIEGLAERDFNGVLCNLYRDGQDSMGWHCDNEPELGPDPVLASISFGAKRRFVFRNKNEKFLKTDILLEAGDILVMGTGTQSNWEHSVPKTSGLVEPRINFTFRRVL